MSRRFSRFHRINSAHLLASALCLLMLAAASCHSDTDSVIPEKEIGELKQTIKASSQYERDMNRHIDSIRQRLKGASDYRKFDINLQLAEVYRQVNTDSAIHYAAVCATLAADAPESRRQQSDIAMVNALSTAGIFTEAEALFNKLGSEPMDSTVKIYYWLAGRTLYSNMRSYVDGQNQYYRLYNHLYLAYDDSLLAHLPASEPFHQFILSERLVTEGMYDEAKTKLMELMHSVDKRSNLYGMAAYQMGEVYRHTGHAKEYAACLAIAARTDVECCVREGMALPTLADWLYDQGEMADAFSFINFALEDAMKGNARMRTVSIAKMVPLIDAAYRERINSSRDELMAYFILATVLFLITAALMLVLFRSIKKLRDSRHKLAKLSKVQESYIGSFIGLCSNYADRLDSLQKTVSRKLQSGQADELLKLVESGKFGEGTLDNNTMFDKAFIDLYPDFTEEINALLRPEEQIVLADPKTLTPELRIYAFVRLGVEESTRIARILRYSVSTVYAYRNRMRNKALNRETFDADVMNIGMQ